MRTLFIFLLALSVIFVIGGCTEAEITEPEEVIEPEEVTEPEEVIEPEEVTFFDFIGWTEEQVLDYFEEDPVFWDDVSVHHLVFNDEEGEKKLFFVFSQDGLVNFLTIYQGNVLGVEIEGEYDPILIKEKLGQPTGEGVMDWRDVELTYMVYYMGEGIHLEFYKNYRAPFSVLIALVYPCLPDYFDWSQEEVLKHFGEKEEMEFRFVENKLVEVNYLEGSEIFGIKIGDLYNESMIIEKIGEPNERKNSIVYYLKGIRGGDLYINLKDGYIESATIKLIQ